MMILLPSTALLLPLLFASPLQSGDEDPRADVVIRTYSVPGPRAAESTGHYARVLPLNRRESMFSSSLDHEPWVIGADAVVDLITSVVTREEWEYENRSIRTDPRGNIVIAATQETHAQVEKLLAYLDTALSSATRVRIDVYAVKQAIDPSFGGTMASAEADDKLREHVSRGALSQPQTLFMDMLPQRLALAGGMEEIRFTSDFDVEIAQASATMDPAVGSFEVGFEVQGRSGRVGSGSALQLVMRMGALLEDLESVECALYREISISDKSFEREVMKGRLDRPTVGFATLGFTTFLPDGKDLVTVIENEGVFGKFARVVRVRATAADVPTSVQLQGGHFSWTDLSLLSSPDVLDNEVSLMGGLPLREDGDVDVLALAPSIHFDTDWIVDYVQPQLPRFDSVETNLMGTFGAGIALFTNADTQATFQKALGEIAAALRNAEDMDLRVTSRDASSQFARITLSTIAGSPVWVAVGGQQWNVVDYDVEVAQSSSINDPKAAAVSDGVIARWSGRPQGSSWRVDLDAALNLQRQRPKLQEIGAWPGTIAVTRALRNRISESFLLGGQGTHRMGDLDPSGERGLHLHLRRR